MTEQTGRDILEGWRSDRAAKETYKTALEELHGEWRIFRGSIEEQIAVVKESLVAERTANKAALRRARSPGFGVFAGAGYAPAGGEVRFVVGVGLVWRVLTKF